MSKPAYVRLVEQIPAIRKMQYADSTGKLRHIGETGAWLLMYLCSELNKDGTFFMTAQSMRELTGTSTVSEIRRLLAGFEQLGLITRTGEEISYLSRGMPTPVYAMTFVPGLWKPDLIGSPLGSPLSSPGATNKQDENPYDKRKTQVSYQIEPEPEPDSEPHPEPGSPRSDDLQEGRQRKEEEVLSICIGLEIESMNERGAEIKPGIRKRWNREYPSLIAKAIEQREGSTPEALAQYCYDIRSVERTGYPSADTQTPAPRLTPAPRQTPKEVCGRCGNKNRDIEGYEGLTTQYRDGKYTPCELCNGTGYHDREPLTEADYFPADEEPTPIEPPTKRVSAGVIGNTYIPTPPGSADPQSFTRLVRDISQTFRAG